MPTIDIYTQPGCPYCIRAVRLLAHKGVPFNEINAPHGTPARAESIRRSGGSTTVPQIFIGDAPVGGCNELMALERAGRLDSLLAAD
ncbi:glutaredoxin 3 [Komagataeibacter sp. FNDCF1]|uniref:glutaredoxin 3 n=1 Tax=Komagataeibacter sp. FNDCF1 TaxID=2878681 RepID=UPI001E456B6B|nr:glutaredoxin 3 [Komagataeibacter sp. FNDCF1]MCE2563852.1 glutaredoxin 3 [Komagataeibacter sp. FNDCF1]